jgi:hypothetical protein
LRQAGTRYAETWRTRALPGMTTYRRAEPHGPLEEVAADLFVVRGSYRAAPLLSIGRTMTVLRQGAELIVFNSVRLSDAGEAELAELGSVAHVVRLGWFHGSDDPYYAERFGAELWAPPGIGAPGRPLVDGAPGPLAQGEMFVFDVPAGGEAIARLPAVDAVVTCDSVQNWETTRGCSLLGRLLTKTLGFYVPAKIGPLWAKRVTNGAPATLGAEFARLLARKFALLLPGHGEPLRDAHEVVRQGVERDLGAAAPAPRLDQA